MEKDKKILNILDDYINFLPIKYIGVEDLIKVKDYIIKLQQLEANK